MQRTRVRSVQRDRHKGVLHQFVCRYTLQSDLCHHTQAAQAYFGKPEELAACCLHCTYQAGAVQRTRMLPAQLS